MQKIFKLFLIAALSAILTACGFHLRGEQALPPQLKTLYIDAAPYAPLTLALKKSLRSADVNIVSAVAQSPLTLQILNENFEQNISNISASTLVKTYTLIYSVEVQLLNKSGKVIYGPQTVKTYSSYAVSDNQILGDNSQLKTQQANMRRDLIGLIFNRLGSDNVRKALASN